MKRRWRLLAGALVLAGFPLAGCTTTYTEQELIADERKEDQQALSDEKRDREIGEEGGSNIQSIDEEIWSIEE